MVWSQNDLATGLIVEIEIFDSVRGRMEVMGIVDFGRRTHWDWRSLEGKSSVGIDLGVAAVEGRSSVLAIQLVGRPVVVVVVHLAFAEAATCRCRHTVVSSRAMVWSPSCHASAFDGEVMKRVSGVAAGGLELPPQDVAFPSCFSHACGRCSRRLPVPDHQE
jgi:hypothetical protein